MMEQILRRSRIYPFSFTVIPALPDSQDVRADQVNLAYQSADVGEHDIEAANITR